MLLSIAGARVLGPAAWGTYWSAFGIAQLAALGTDLGGHLTLARNAARSPATAWTSASVAAAVKLILTIIVVPTVVAVTPALHQRAPLLWPITAAALALSIIEWLGYFLRGLGRVREEAVLLGSTSFVGCLAGAVVLAASASPERLAVSQLLAMAACLAVAIPWVLRMVPLRGWDPTPSDHALAGFFRSAWPTGAAILISMASWRLVYLLHPPVGFPDWLSRLFGRSHVESIGLYAAAQRLLEIGRFLPAAAAAALFPSFVRGRGLPPGQTVRWLVGVTAVAAGALWIPGVAGGAVTLIFGADYAGAAPVLAVMALALPFMSVNAVMTHWLVARGHAGTNAALSGIHLAVHAVWLIGFPALQAPQVATISSGLTSEIVPYPYHFTPALLAAGLVFAEIALTIGTLIAWRRLK